MISKAAASGAVSGMLFIQPESTLGQQLQALFGSTGTPAIIAVDKRAQSADHTGDGNTLVALHQAGDGAGRCQPVDSCCGT